MDVKVIDMKTSLKDLMDGTGLDQFLNTLREALNPKPAEPVTEEELAGFSKQLDGFSDEMLRFRQRIANAMDQTKSDWLSGAYGQIYAHISNSGTSLSAVIELLDVVGKKLKHDRECACKAETPTEAPPASEPESGATAGAE